MKPTTPEAAFLGRIYGGAVTDPAAIAEAARADDDDGEQHQQGRERLWLSPHCLGAEVRGQMGLFGG